MAIWSYTNTASTSINTYFIRMIPQWRTLTVGDTAIASRAPVVMTLVLDRTGSMDSWYTRGRLHAGYARRQVFAGCGHAVH